MGREYIVKTGDDQFVTAGDSIEEIIDNLEEQEGMKDVEEMVEEYDF